MKTNKPAKATAPKTLALSTKALSKGQLESIAELETAVASCHVASYMLAHGYLKSGMKAKDFKVIFPDKSDLKEATGRISAILSRAADRGLLKGEVTGLRAHMTGSLQTSVKSSPIGKIMADAMAKTVHEAQVAIANGIFPRMLCIPAGTKDTEIAFKVQDSSADWKLDYRLAKSALGMGKGSAEDVLSQLTAMLADAKNEPLNVVPMVDGTHAIVKLDKAA